MALSPVTLREDIGSWIYFGPAVLAPLFDYVPVCDLTYLQAPFGLETNAFCAHATITLARFPTCVCDLAENVTFFELPLVTLWGLRWASPVNNSVRSRALLTLPNPDHGRSCTKPLNKPGWYFKGSAPVELRVCFPTLLSVPPQLLPLYPTGVKEKKAHYKAYCPRKLESTIHKLSLFSDQPGGFALQSAHVQQSFVVIMILWQILSIHCISLMGESNSQWGISCIRL